MEKLNHFFECYFNISIEYEELENIIQHVKRKESQIYIDQLIAELKSIIEKGWYEKAVIIMKKNGRKMSLKETEKFIKFLYDRFNNILGSYGNIKKFL